MQTNKIRKAKTLQFIYINHISPFEQVETELVAAAFWEVTFCVSKAGNDDGALAEVVSEALVAAPLLHVL